MNPNDLILRIIVILSLAIFCWGIPLIYFTIKDYKEGIVNEKENK